MHASVVFFHNALTPMCLASLAASDAAVLPADCLRFTVFSTASKWLFAAPLSPFTLSLQDRLLLPQMSPVKLSALLYEISDSEPKRTALSKLFIACSISKASRYANLYRLICTSASRLLRSALPRISMSPFSEMLHFRSWSIQFVSRPFSFAALLPPPIIFTTAAKLALIGNAKNCVRVDLPRKIAQSLPCFLPHCFTTFRESLICSGPVTYIYILYPPPCLQGSSGVFLVKGPVLGIRY